MKYIYYIAIINIMKKNKKLIFIVLALMFITPYYSIKAESESALKREIQQKTEELNTLYDQVENINDNIEKNKEKSDSLKSDKKNIQNNLEKDQNLISNILLFLQYYTANDLWMLVLSSDNVITNVYLFNNIFSKFAKDFKDAINQIDDLKELEISYDKNVEELEDEKEKLENQVKEYEKAYDDLQVKLQELQKEESFDLTTNSNAAINQSSQNSLMTKAGISPSNFGYVDYIVSIESSWNYTAVNPYSGAYGLCQALPATKMAQFGADWKTNPVTQLKFCNSYANSRYGSWAGAASFMKSNGWW